MKVADTYSAQAILSCLDKGFSSGMKAAAGVTDRLASKFKNGFSFGAWASAGASAFKSVTGGVTGFAKSVVQSGMEFESTMSTVKAISGATAGEMQELTDLAKEMGATTKFTATESAEALKYMGMAGWNAEQMIAGLPGILNLAAAGEADLGTTSDIVTDGLTAFGLTAGDAAQFSDALAAAATSTNTDILKMGETFKYVGPVCGSLGASMEDTAVAAGLMANAGTKASDAGTSLRRGLQNLIKPTEPIAAAMEKYGVALATTADGSADLMGTMKNLRSALGGLTKVERSAALAAIFGSEAQSGWAAIVNASDKDFKDITESIYNSKDAAEKMAEIEMDNLAGDVTLLESAWDGVRQSIYGLEKGPLRSIVQTATKVVDVLNTKLSDESFLKSVDGFIKNVSKYVDALLESFSGVGSAFGDAFSAIGDSLAKMNGEFGATKSVDGFKSAMKTVADVLKKVAGFLEDHADTIAKVINALPKLLAAFMAFKIVKKVVGPVVKFGGAIAKLAGGGISAISGRLWAISKSETDVGKAAKKTSRGMRASAKSKVASAKAFMMVGAGVLMISAGFALLAKSAIELSKAGGPAIGIMAGLVAAVVGLSLGMAAMTKSLTKASPKKLAAVTKTLWAIGGAIAAIVLSLAVFALAVQPLASLGTTAVAPLAAFGIVVAGLAAVFAAVGKKLKASVVGIVAFAAAISVMALAMAPIAATGTEGATAMAAFGAVVAGLVVVFSIFGTALNAAVPGMIGLAIAAVGVGAGMRLATPFIEALPPVIKQVGDTASQVAGAVADAVVKIADAFGGLVSTIADAVAQIAESVGNTLCQVFEAAGEAIATVVDSISGGVAEVVDAISGGFATVLDSISGIFDSIGEAALNAGKGFNEMATGIQKIVGLNIVDLGASLAAVATGIGSITAVSGGLESAGAGMANIGTGLQAISTYAALAAEKMALLPAVITPLGAAVPILVSVFGQLTVAVATFVASSSGLSVFVSQVFVLVLTLSTAAGAASAFGGAVSAAGSGLLAAAGSAGAASSAVSSIAKSAASARSGIAGLSSALNSMKHGFAGLGSVARSAVAQMVSAFAAGAGKARSAGRQIGVSMQSGVSAGMTKTVAAVRKAFASIDSVLHSGASKAKATGTQTGNNLFNGMKAGLNKVPAVARSAMSAFSSAISSGASKAVATAKRAAASIVSALRSAHSGAYSAGRYIVQGLVNGLSSMLGQVRSMAAKVAAAADKAIKAKAKISSPSKVMIKNGRYIGAGLVVGMDRERSSVYAAGAGLASMASLGITDEAEIHSPSKKAQRHGANVGKGFANGLLSSFKTVQAASKSLAKTAFKDLQNITNGKKGGFSSAATKVGSTYEKDLTAKMNTQLSKMKQRLNKTVKKNKGLKKALNAAYDQYSKYLKQTAEKAISKAQDRLDKLGKAYQEKYEAFRDRLREYGDMFTADKYGYVSLKNFDEMTKQLKTLSANLEKLKGWGLSQNFMEELAGMDTASALTMTNELLSRGEAAALAYSKSYDKAMSTAASVSDKFYQSYFNADVKDELAALQTDLNTIGKNAMQGFIKGMKSKAKSLKGASKSLANSVIKVFQKYLKIHSPSKVFARLGQFVGAGFINGMDSMAGKVQDAVETLTSLPDIQVPALAAPGGSLRYSGVSEGLAQVPDTEYVIIVPVELDGREVARVTAPYTQQELTRLENRSSRKRGVR